MANSQRAVVSIKTMRCSLLLLTVWSILVTPVWAKQLEVSPAGPLSTIKSALAVAEAGDTIIVGPGVYPEHDLKILHPVTLKGVGNPVIDGELQGTILSINADDVTVEGLTLRNVGRSFTSEYAAIYLSKSRRFNISNNVLSNVFFGIHAERCKFGVIAHNQISGEAEEEASSGNGIHLWHSSEVSIHDNIVHQLRDGIYFEFVNDSEIFRNKSFNNLRYGLHFMFSNRDNYYENTFDNNGAGVAVMFSKFIDMHDNQFINNWGASSYGLLLKEIYDGKVENNTFEQNSVGIRADGTTRLNYLGNRFLQNGWAIKVAGACYTNVFRGNRFEHNTFDLSYNSQLNDNEFDGNYWSDYTGYDLDRDGVGDVPHRPVKLFSYIVNRTPESIVLMRSLFVDIINFSEKVSPVFTPDALIDNTPSMKAKIL